MVRSQVNFGICIRLDRGLDNIPYYLCVCVSVCLVFMILTYLQGILAHQWLRQISIKLPFAVLRKSALKFTKGSKRENSISYHFLLFWFNQNSISVLKTLLSCLSEKTLWKVDSESLSSFVEIWKNHWWVVGATAVSNRRSSHKSTQEIMNVLFTVECSISISWG